MVFLEYDKSRNAGTCSSEYIYENECNYWPKKDYGIKN
jgi:hypothetical protein